VSKTRQFLSKVGQAMTRRPSKTRKPSPDRTLVGRSPNENKSIILASKNGAKIQLSAEKIQRGKWGKADALYLRIGVTMMGMTGRERAHFMLCFQTHQRGSTPGEVPFIHYWSPKRLLGVPQDVEEGKESTWGFGLKLGADKAGVDGHGDQTNNSKLTKQHRPKLEVREIDSDIIAHLSKTGRECSFESYFSIQVVISYDKTTGVDIAGDIEAEPFGKAKGNWRKVKVPSGGNGDTNYQLWSPAEWKEEGNCEGFVTK
jgi:hypothetical protein